MRGLFPISALAMLAATVIAVFGQPDLAPYYQVQRNGAMDLVAQCSAANAELRTKVADLEKRLQEAGR